MSGKLDYLATFMIVIFLLLEFRAEVHGRPTILGCFIRSMDEISDSRCATPTTPERR